MTPPTRLDDHLAIMRRNELDNRCHCEARKGCGNPFPLRRIALPVPGGGRRDADCHGPDGPRNDSCNLKLVLLSNTGNDLSGSAWALPHALHHQSLVSSSMLCAMVHWLWNLQLP